MKRSLAVAFIAGYITLLAFGNACHLLRYRTGCHPLMYMIVWDMFCGWSAYDSRVHIIAEGESENFYNLSTPPWGEIHAFGYVGRENYDSFNTHSGTIALNVLKHTSHEPIRRVMVFEEAFPKKLNLPDHVWNLRYDVPKDPHQYFRLRLEMLPDGTILRKNDCFISAQGAKMALDNPRLMQEMTLNRPMFWNERRSLVDGEGLAPPRSAAVPVAAPSAN